MHHQPGTRLVGHGPSGSHGLVGVPVSHGVDVHPDLYAEAESGILLDVVGGLVNVDYPHVMQPTAQHSIDRQAHTPDVQERQQSRAVGREHVVPHGLVVQEPGTAGVHTGGRAGGEADLVGVHRGGVATVVEVAVQVDQPRRDQFARDVNGPVGLGGVNSLGNCSNQAVLERHIPAVIDTLGWVEQGAPAEQQVIGGCGSRHCSSPIGI